MQEARPVFVRLTTKVGTRDDVIELNTSHILSVQGDGTGAYVRMRDEYAVSVKESPGAVMARITLAHGRDEPSR